MPKIGITTYNLLISCPSDVKDEIKIIKDVVDSFNTLIGQANNIQIITKHWSKNSYPESGGKPQALLNKQFVFDCDAAIAVFWTRFGTPTEEYESGTEEEIEELIKSGKQVFLYFCDALINPSTIDVKQYNKVNEFKEKYKYKGIYGSYSDSAQFKTDFLNHLTLYFLDLIKKPNSITINKNVPKLILQGVSKGKPSAKLSVVNKEWLSVQRFEKLKADIMSKFNYIESISLSEPPTKKQMETIPKGLNTGTAFNKQFAVPSLENFGLFSVEIDEKTVFIIKSYADKIGSKLSDNFFYLANLKKSQNLMAAMTGGSNWSLSGSDDEEQKYCDIIELKDLIIEYKQLTNYFSKISAMSYLEICISNIGATFDEDIDVYLKIPKNCYCLIKNLPLPENDIIEQFNGDLINTIFKPEESVSISEYSDYPPHYISPPRALSPLLYSKSRQAEIDEAKDDYSILIGELFCYAEYEDEDYNILHFNLKYLKQNISMFIPTNIHFSKLPDVIKYEIKSKYNAEVVKGTLEL
jgi:hypothetical protein